MTFAAVLLFAGALFLNAGTPGPSIAALVAQVVARGARPVVPFVAAMWIGEALWLGLAIAGLTVVAREMHLLFVAVKWAGIAYLVWLAFGMWRDADRTADDTGDRRGSPLRLFATGMALTLGNPKIMIFYLALLPSLIDVDRVGLVDWAVLTLVQIGVMAVCDLTWLSLAARARALLATPRFRRTSRRVGAMAMAGAAAAIASRG